MIADPSDESNHRSFDVIPYVPRLTTMDVITGLCRDAAVADDAGARSDESTHAIASSIAGRIAIPIGFFISLRCWYGALLRTRITSATD